MFPSPHALSVASTFLGEVDLLSQSRAQTFPVIFDSGATLAISPNKGDFIGGVKPMIGNSKLGGLANSAKIAGYGTVKWQFKTKNSSLVVTSYCFYVPEATARLISPQRLFCKEKGVTGTFTCTEDHATLKYDKKDATLQIEYNETNFLPTAYAKNITEHSGMDIMAQAHLAVLDEENQNLTPSQKLLLHWHNRLGHRSLAYIQSLFRGKDNPFHSTSHKSASRCAIPKCEICMYAKSHRRPTRGKRTSINPKSDGNLSINHLRPGQAVSVDHFESRLKGRTLTSRGSLSADMYKGGCIFVDHMSGYVHVEHQLGFSAAETVRAKHNFEKVAFDHGVLIQEYLADNGAFRASDFVRHINEQNQKINYCGVNAHHQNAIAERNIRTVSETARAMLLHAAFHWKDAIDSSLWPMAVSYACYLHNHLPNSQGIAPADLFTGQQVPRHKLRDLHVWGSPVYVLDPKLQQGQKLPRWEPRARQGIFMGFSMVHSSDVPLILNPRTGNITPQFHVVFDDEFSTVKSCSSSDDPPEFWRMLELDEGFRDARSSQIPLDDDIDAQLDASWLSNDELELRERENIRSEGIRRGGDVYERLRTGGVHASPCPFDAIPMPTSPTSVDPSLEPTVDPSAPLATDPIPLDLPTGGASAPIPSTPSSKATTSGTPGGAPSSPAPSLPPPAPSPPSPVKAKNASPTKASKPNVPSSEPRRSSRAKRSPHRYIPGLYHNPAYTTSSKLDEYLAHKADIETDFDTGVSNCSDPLCYAAKTKSNPDMPSLMEAMRSANAHEWCVAMKKEIAELIRQNTWEYLNRSDVPSFNGKKRTVLGGTWAFKLKRLPDGTPLKFKARYCVRGDRQTHGIDYFETYAPVVQWSTVRLLLTLVLSKNWVTKQVDYTNAFAQATLKEEVYIDPPKGFHFGDGKDKVLKLIKSLYGLKQAPLQFYEKLSEGLIERGFTQSALDPCLFMKQEMICVVYVDDTIIAGPDSEKIEELITDLGVSNSEKQHTFTLRDEGEVGDFLGIQIERSTKGFELSQPGLINKVLEETGMTDCNPSKTPAATVPLHIDSDGESFQESWDYATVVGMLMYLATNSRPDVAYAVNQCARFTHCPRNSHALAVKRVVRYLQGTKEKGLIMNPRGDFNVDCYVDADFAGLWKSEDPTDPISVKSRTGYIVTFMGCPLTWLSKLQSQIALSTMEAEYIALSTAMREIIAVREVLKEIYTIVLTEDEKKLAFRTVSTAFEPLPQSRVHEDNEACLKFAQTKKMNPRTKHIAIPYHFFHSKIKDLEIKVVSCATKDQLADQFTKGLPESTFRLLRDRLMGW